MIRTITTVWPGAMNEMLDRPRRQACSVAARARPPRWTFEHHYRQLLDVFAEARTRKQAA